MRLIWSELGTELLGSASRAEREVVLVAPFIKSSIVGAIFEALHNDVHVKIFTRWRVEELASGVSDLNVWSDVASRGNSSLSLINNLHSKYYRFDSEIFLGSANLTLMGLGLRLPGNYETFVTTRVTELSSSQFENDLIQRSLIVDELVYERATHAVERFKSINPVSFVGYGDDIILPTSPEVRVDKLAAASSERTLKNLCWLPVTRSPEIVYKVYSGNTESASVDAVSGVKLDLEELQVPHGIRSEEAFNAVIRARLELSVICTVLDRFLDRPRRFGEIRAFLKPYLLAGEDETLSWQTLMRWLLFFCPGKYVSHTANYSEIFYLL
jgi:hypothetical protein